MCYNAADAEARLAKSVDRIHFDEAWYGYARFNPMYRDRFAMRGDPGRSSGGRPHRLRDAFDPQAAGGALADLLHPHPRRPGRHRSRPVQRGLLHPGEHVAALRADRVERRRGGHDGRPGRARAHPGGHRRGGRVPAGRGAGPAGVPGEEGLVLRARGTPRRSATPRPASGSPSTRRRPSCWPPIPTAGCSIPDESWHGFEGIPDNWCMLDPIKFGIVCPGMKPDGKLDEQGHPGRHRHRLPRPPRDRPVAHDRPHGAVPLLRRHHQGQVGDAPQHAAGLQERLRPQRPARQVLPDIVAAAPDRYAGMGLKDLGDEMWAHMKKSRQGHWQAQAYASLPTPEMTPRRAFQQLMAGNAEKVAARSTWRAGSSRSG